MIIDKVGFVSICDHNPINQNCLKLLIKSAEKFLHQRVNKYVLIPDSMESQKLSNWICGQNVNILKFKSSCDNEDPYFVKFLLSDFINTENLNIDYLFYLDPDHIIRDKFKLDLIEDEIVVSSEIIKSETYSPKLNFLYPTYDTNYFNTSFIYGKVRILREVCKVWKETYLRIKDIIHYRHREEVAFSLSAFEKGIKLKPVKPQIQSNYKVIDNSWKLFHYGGDSKRAIEIKKKFENYQEGMNNLRMIKKNSIDSTQIEIVKAMLEMDI
jgi:hypothetical protein